MIGVFGIPGSGKTRYLIDQVIRYANDGIPIDRIAYMSFTRAAVGEAKARIKSATNCPDKAMNNFRTIHSLAYRICALHENRIFNDFHAMRFSKIMGDKGIKVSIDYDENTVNLYNLPLYLHHMAVNTGQSLDDIIYKYHNEGTGLTRAEIKNYLYNYQEYKRHFNLYDFNDMLIKAVEKCTFNVGALIVDEIQDCTPLQWRLIEKIASPIKVVAGDDDQSIYQWSGVDVKEFVNREYENTVVLKDSHRLPAPIFNYATEFWKRPEMKATRKEKPLSSIRSEHAGAVVRAFDFNEIIPAMLEKKNETWFLLVRNICYERHYSEILTAQGIPFSAFGRNRILSSDIKVIIENEKKKGTLEYLPWFDALRNTIDFEKALYYRLCLANGYKIHEPPRVEITTIHRVKGREADNVVVLPDITRTTDDGRYLHPGQEDRIFYVAATRAKKTLYVLRPCTDIYYEL